MIQGGKMKISRLKHGLIYVDPPWKYEMYSPDGEGKSPQIHYDCMALDEMKDMRDDVLFATDDDAVMVMWTTFAFLDQAMELMSHWGFKYKTGGPWIKRTRHGKQSFGTGYVLRSSAELFLIGTVGKPKLKPASKNTRNIIIEGDFDEDIKQIHSIIVDQKAREHSRKPDKMIELIESLFDGPYLELFARTSRPGWEVWGNETEKF